MNHALALPLADKEVVLTFDDGPVPRYSNQVLDALAAQCVKATFFLVGEMAREYPATVRRIFADGHTIGTHSEDHPPRFGNRQALTRLMHQISETSTSSSSSSSAGGNP